MLGLKTKAIYAEKAKRYLLKHNFLDRRYKIFRKGSFIYLPLTKATKETVKKLKRIGEVVKTDFPSTNMVPNSYRTMLKKVLGKDYEKAPKGYDILGNIAIIDAPKSIAKKVGKVIMEINKNVETVLRKEGAVKGRYRTRSYSHVLGAKNYIATYKENGCIFRFDVRKVFFSSRLAYERMRISRLVKSNENVLVLFAGVGPFAIEIAKAHPDANVVAVELNRYAYRYMLENIRLNGISNVTAICCDAKKLGKEYNNFANRIVMPLPKDSYEFLDAAYRYAKNGCVVHYYAFGERQNAFEYHIEKIELFFGKFGEKVEIIGRREVRPYSAHEIEIVLDFSISKKAKYSSTKQ